MTPLNAFLEQIWREVLHIHDPHSWCKFHKVKGHQMEDCYEIKKEIERLIQKGELKKYVKDSSAREPSESNSQGRDYLDIIVSIKGNEPNKGGENISIFQTPNTIAE